MSTPAEFKPNNTDLIIALIATFGMPLILGLLYDLTGALIPMLIYYVLFCVIVVMWRKKSLEYHIPKNWAIKYFLIFVGVQIVTQIFAAILIKVSYDPLIGILLTVLIWAPINAFMEQILWIYVFDSIAFRFPQDEPKKKIIGIILGIILTFTLVGVIHVVYWPKFLMEIEIIRPWFQLFMAFQFLSTTGYIVMYKKTKSMLPSAILHLIIDVSAVLIAQYSIIPYLIMF